MKKSIEEKQYEKDVKFAENLKTLLFSFLTITPEQEKHRFVLRTADGKVRYIPFSKMDRLNAAEKRIKIYELSHPKA